MTNNSHCFESNQRIETNHNLGNKTQGRQGTRMAYDARCSEGGKVSKMTNNSHCFESNQRIETNHKLSDKTQG